MTEKEDYKQLQELENRLKAASAIAKPCYWRLKLDATSLSWTEKVYRIWSRNREDFELNYENFFQRIHPNDQKAFEVERNSAFAREKALDFVHRIILPEGSIRWVHEPGYSILPSRKY